MNVAVIGGGYAGMAAAVTLAEAGVPVTVYEAARELGGRARRVPYRDVALDNGQHILIGAYRETLRLIDLVHPNPRDVLMRLPLRWQMHGRFYLEAANLPAPFHLLWGLLRADGVPFGERWRAVCFMAGMRARGFRIEHDMTVAELLARHDQGAALTRYLWEPLCVSALNTPAASASARVFLNVLRDSLASDREASEILLARTDLTSLFPAPAAEYVSQHGGSVRIATRVTAVQSDTGEFSVTANGDSMRHTHVICALPPHQLPAFIGGIDGLEACANTIRALAFQPIVTIYFQFADRVALPAAMLGLDDAMTQWLFDREALAGQRGLVAAVISASGAHEELTQDALAAHVLDEIAQRFGPLPTLEWSRVIAEKRATFNCVPGLERPSAATPLAHFWLAGDYVAGDYPATLEGAVRSGIHCGNLLIKSMG